VINIKQQATTKNKLDFHFSFYTSSFFYPNPQQIFSFHSCSLLIAAPVADPSKVELSTSTKFTPNPQRFFPRLFSKKAPAAFERGSLCCLPVRLKKSPALWSWQE